MKKVDLEIPGAFVVEPACSADRRGAFVKTFHAGIFANFGVRPEFVEEYYTVSHRDVIRGMHFQKPPCAHAKLVTCLRGAVLDVVVDLRQGSPAYGRPVATEMNESNRRVLYLPIGIAHGFRALEEGSLVLYQATSAHSPEHDSGIHWASIGFGWGLESPIISDRDADFPPLAGFETPFR